MRSRFVLLLPLALAFLSLRAATAADEKPLPVTKEPFHRPVFENDVLRIIDVQIPEGATCKYHVHEIPSVVVYLTKSTNKSQTFGETDPKKFLDRTLMPGEARYAPYDTQPLTHRVTNTGQGLFRVFDIELLHAKPANPPAFAALPAHAKLQFEEKLARMSKVTLPAKGKLELPADGHARLVVGVSGTVVTESKPLKWADYRFLSAKTDLTLTNGGNEEAVALLLELN